MSSISVVGRLFLSFFSIFNLSSFIFILATSVLISLLIIFLLPLHITHQQSYISPPNWQRHSPTNSCRGSYNTLIICNFHFSSILSRLLLCYFLEHRALQFICQMTFYSLQLVHTILLYTATSYCQISGTSYILPQTSSPLFIL